MKKLLLAGIVVVAVIVVVVLLLFSNLNPLIAKVIERKGSEVTQTSVHVSGVDISLRDGRGSIKGLEVANPEEFNGHTAFSLDDITVAIDIKSIRENPVVINEIRVRAPVVSAEITKTGSFNIDALRKRIQEYAGGTAGGGGESGAAAKRVRIERFVFEQGRIEVDASALGLEKQTVVLPEIRLDDIGGASGVPPSEIAKTVLAAFTGKATSAIADSEVDRLIKDKMGGSLMDKAKGLLEKIGE